MPSFWHDPGRILNLSIRIAWTAVAVQLLGFAGGLFLRSEYGRDLFEENKPEWVTEMRKAIETRRQRLDQQQEQRQKQ